MFWDDLQIKNASLFIAKNVTLLHHPLCNLSILLSVNLTNFANLFHFSSFGAGLSKVIYFTACNLVPTLKNKSNACGSLFLFNQFEKLFDFSTILHLGEDLSKSESTTNQSSSSKWLHLCDCLRTQNLGSSQP